MTKLEIQCDWDITKGKLKQKWAMLTHNHLLLVEGKREESLGRIKRLMVETREAVEKAIEEPSSG